MNALPLSTFPDQDITLKHRIGMVHSRRLLLVAGEAMDQNKAGQERETELGWFRVETMGRDWEA